MLKDQKELADVFYERERDKKSPWYSDLLILKRGYIQQLKGLKI